MVFGAVAVAVAVLGVGAGVAAVISQTVLADTTDVHLRIVRTEANGFDSGWHTHPGPVIVQVQQGYFQIFQGSCTPKIIRAGQTYVEVPELPIRAVATGHIKWTTSMILPAGVPVSTAVSSPCASP
jgi:quercetin dioxygenase-like cupin family protein